MDFYVYLNGQQQGPLTKEQLEALRIAPDTPVWYEGLKDWTPAEKAEETAWLFKQQTPPPFGQQPESSSVPPYQQQSTYAQSEQPHYRQPQYAQPQEEQVPPCPNNNLAWAIIVTVLCCLPCGIVAIIKAASVNEKYNRGDYAGAEEAAKSARTWSIVGAIIAAVVYVIYFGVVVATSLMGTFGY